MREPPPPRRLHFPTKLSYSAGQLVELVVGSMLNIFAMFYVTAICGLPGLLAGLALGAGLVIDAIMNPLIGSVSDGWKSRFGRRVPFMAAGVIPLILSFNLIFALPSGLGTTGLFLWLLALSITLRVSLSFFALPYQALGAELSDDYTERSSIATWRWGIGIIGTVAVIGLGYGVFLSGPGGVSRRDAYSPLALTLTALIIVGALLAIRTGLATRHGQYQAVETTEPLHHRLRTEMAEVFRNRTFRLLFASSLLTNVAQGVNQSLSLHVGIYFWQLTPEMMQAFATAAVLGLALGAPLAGPLGRHMEKRTMLIIGSVGLAICHSGPTTLRLLGLLPLTGSALTSFLAGVAMIGGMMFALSIISFLAIMPDAADEHEHQFGTRREGLFFAGAAFASTAATGAGLLLAGLVLEAADFPADTADHAAVTAVPESTANWLAFAGGPGAALLALTGLVFILFYRLDRRTHARIMTDLVARRGA